MDHLAGSRCIIPGVLCDFVNGIRKKSKRIRWNKESEDIIERENVKYPGKGVTIMPQKMNGLLQTYISEIKKI